MNLWQKYQGRVHFVIIDLDRKQKADLQELVRKYYRGYIPHVLILDRTGNPVYDRSGEVEELVVSGILDKSLP